MTTGHVLPGYENNNTSMYPAATHTTLGPYRLGGMADGQLYGATSQDANGMYGMNTATAPGALSFSNAPCYTTQPGACPPTGFEAAGSRCILIRNPPKPRRQVGLH